MSIYEAQVDGSVNSPAHLSRYLTHVSRALRESADSRPADATPVITPGEARGPVIGDLRLASLGGAGFVDAEVAPGSPVAGKLVGEVSLGDEVLLVAVRHGARTIIPTATTRLAEGDHAIVIAGPGRADHVLQLFGPTAP